MIWKYFTRKRRDADFAREAEAHIAHEIDENIAAGMTPDDARAAALRRFGNVTRAKERIHEMNTVGLFDAAARDLRHAVRLLRLQPGFTVVALLSLTLGIGANTAIFQLLAAVSLRSLPVSHPEELVLINIDNHGKGRIGNFENRLPLLTNAQWEQVRDRQHAFQQIFVWGSTRFNLQRSGEARPAEGLWVSGDYFTTLGVVAVAGRLLNSSDDVQGCSNPTAVISYPFWQREYGGDSSAVGRQIFLDGHAAEIVGVSPASFWGVEVGRSFDIAVPLCARATLTPTDNALENRTQWWLAAIGRLKPGWSMDRAAADLRDISAAIFQDTVPSRYPAIEAKNYLLFTFTASSAAAGPSTLRRDYESSLWLLIAMTGLVLLIACANIANLLLARASTRQRELSIRLAIGASRRRVIGQLLMESFLLASGGAILGVSLAPSFSRILLLFISTRNKPLNLAVQTDWRTLAFVAALTTGTTLLFGLIPAIRATRTAPQRAMRASGRGVTPSRERHRLQRILVVAQVSLSCILSVGALLCVRSLRNLRTTNLGFQSHGLITVNADASQLNLPEERRRDLFRQLEDRIRSASLVEGAASVENAPVMGSWSNRNIFLGSGTQPIEKRLQVNFNAVGPRYFATAETQVLAGRDFNDQDMPSSPSIAIVDESFSRKFLNGMNPVGQRFYIEGDVSDKSKVTSLTYEIVGMVRDSKYVGIRDEFTPTIIVDLNQVRSTTQDTNFVIRSSASPSLLIPVVKQAISEISPDLAIQFRVFDTEINESLAQERLMATLSSFFGFLAAALAAIGVYGMLSYTVMQRRNEIGIRFALGAQRQEVMKMVLKETSVLVLLGLMLGVPAALLSSRALSSILFGLKPGDPLTVLLASLGLCLLTFGASYLPARRAAGVDTATVLREE